MKIVTIFEPNVFSTHYNIFKINFGILLLLKDKIKNESIMQSVKQRYCKVLVIWHWHINFINIQNDFFYK